jgi:hypothetical protein
VVDEKLTVLVETTTVRVRAETRDPSSGRPARATALEDLDRLAQARADAGRLASDAGRPGRDHRGAARPVQRACVVRSTG